MCLLVKVSYSLERLVAWNAGLRLTLCVEIDTVTQPS
jgi:hypothetical protein